MHFYKLFLAIGMALMLREGQLGAQEVKVSPTGGTNSIAAGVHSMKAAGLENLFQLSGRIYSGSAPEGDAGFASLKKLGVKTIITVDGMQPDVETASRYGIRYVHLPIGYDGVPTNQAARMIKAAETLPGPIYVHCHHGMHRGPAGAAVICMGMEGWTAGQAEAWPHLAGTSSNYAGLYRTVGQYRPPSSELLKKLPADFPERSKVSALADVMIEIDGRFDNIKLLRKSDFKTTASHPDLEPAQEAALLSELFAELRRSGITDKRGADFKAKLDEAVEAASAIKKCFADNPVNAVEAGGAVKRMNEDCAACHAAHRN